MITCRAFGLAKCLRRKSFFLTCALLFLSLQLVACRDSGASVVVQFRNADGSQSPAIQAELAVTPSQRARGLMYRKTMADSEGMLFLFPDEEERSFWMKNTYLELDIIFLDRDFRVVSIAKRAVPLSESARPSRKAAKYVVEVNGGLSDRWGVGEGSHLTVEGALPEAK
ncbi:MAG: DUF192 domain-containing protein [Bdellovibrionales bacterium]|nr:DUF192 domain-containing protein [Bdellovibrionales bacterium]